MPARVLLRVLIFSDNLNCMDNSADEKIELVTGQVERVTFRGENDWSVLRVSVSGKKVLVTVVGYSTAQPGEQVSARGVWKNDPSFGIQFAAQAITATKPTTADGMARYLASGTLPGVGPATAKAIVDTFGADTLQVLDEQPEKLAKVKGLGKKKIERIAKGWVEQRAVSQIMLFLNEHEIPPHLCRRIYKKYEAKAIEVISTDPYRLALEVSGIGFKSADKIAHQVGISPTSPERIRAGLVYVMQEATSTGHCGLHELDLIQKSIETLNVPPDLVAKVLTGELSEQDERKRYLEIHADTVYLSSIARCEERVSETLVEMLRKRVPWKINAEQAIEQAQKSLGFKLAVQQHAGVKMALENRVSVLTGGPGTGKTSTLNTLLHIFKKNKVRVHLAAPTGKAAQRASEVTGVEASTIHRLLGLKGPGVEPSEIEDGVLVIDEFSMVDIYLMTNIIKAAKNIPVIMVGDVDQLPSVGPGQVLADLIGSGVVPVTRLTQVFRQAAGSLIIRNAHNINRGQMPERGGRHDDFFFIQMEETNGQGERLEPAEVGAQITATIADLVTQRLPSAYGMNPIRDIMVLSPMNITTTGVANLNAVLQSRLNPEPGKAITRMGTRFGVGDKVIQTRNNYDLDIFNGDIGIITDIDDEADNKLFVDFSGRTVEIPFDDADALRLAYCMTIHKSQGSQADAVVIPVSTQHYTMLQRNLFYTGVTRAKKLVVLVGVPRAMQIAVRNDQALNRITRLRELLQTEKNSNAIQA